jgi:Outer membrane lipoprotein-sorting protein
MTFVQRAGMAALSAFILVIQGTLAAASAVPKSALSVPAGADADAIRKLCEQCTVKDKIFVLPAVFFQPGTGDGAPMRRETQERLLQAMPEGAEAYLHIRARANGLTATTTERVVTDRVTAFMSGLPLSAAAVRGLIVEIEEPVAVPDIFSFALVSAALRAKASKAGMQLAFVMPNHFMELHTDMVKRLATYSDFLGTSFTPDWRADAKWVAEQAMNKPMLLKVDAAADPAAAGARQLDAMLAASGSPVEVLWIDVQDGRILERLCALSNLLSRVMKGDIAPVAPETTGFRLQAQGAELKWFADGLSGDLTILAKVSGQTRSFELSSEATGNFDIEWYNPVSGSKLQTSAVRKTDKGMSQTGTSDGGYALITIHKLGADERVRAAVEVREKADLTVQEVIARWQRYRETQRQKLDNYTASCFMNLHFESTNIGSGFDVSMQFRQFANKEGLVEWEQTGFFVNGVRYKKQREFPLPQLEPEKVMTQPLELKLNEKYEYKLLGTEQVNGTFCYVIGVEPTELKETLYSGKMWIDGTTFRQVKVHLNQKGGKTTNVVANAETQNFELISDGKGNDYNLPASIYAQQTLNAAGRNFILQKTYKFSEFKINSKEFEGELAATRKSDNPMYRDTEQGLRLLKKESSGERVVQAANQKRVRSIVAGALYEGTYDFPIPLAGISIVDFNFRNTGSQLSVFFAGPILAANLSKQYRSKFRAGIDLALSALPGNNRVFTGNTEIKQQNLWLWEEFVGLRATYQATPSFSLTGSTHMSYEHYRNTADTDKSYTQPRNGVTLIPGAELKYARRGYVFTAEGSMGKRVGWEPFGFSIRPEPTHDTYTRYSADFAKTIYMGRFTKAGWDFAYFGGDRLDRFSQYRPSFFSRPRIHGVPNGTDSFDALAIGSVNYGLNVLEFLKFEGQYTYARARNKFESRQFRKFDGLEVNFGTAGPWGTYLQGTVTYALHGNIPRYNSRWGAYIMVFKPLR